MAFENLKSGGITKLLSGFLNRIDAVYQKIATAVKSVNGIEPNEDGDIPLVSVPYAQNLESESSKRVYDTFIQRTAGGATSISTGNAWLMGVKGDNTHDDFVPESINMEVSGLGETPITATLNRDVFVEAVLESGRTILVYSTAWSADPSNYGITVSGTPVAGDTITIDYVKEERGTIVVANPQSFIATGWNLYNHTLGYAKVVKYAFGYRIDGTYSALKFSETINGTKTDVTVTDGSFDIPSDGYVWVTDGDPDDTAIYTTWEDWTEEPDEEFQPYVEHVVDLSAVMASKFPYGLLKAGSVVDEIDLNLGQAISRVDRMTYNSTNLATAKASGRECEYDENYIYLERASAIISSVSIDGAFDSDDHGIEYFDSEVAVETEILYGVNLKNKLEREVLTVSQQTLTEAQKSQVRQNLEVANANIESDFLAIRADAWGKGQHSLKGAFCCAGFVSGSAKDLYISYPVLLYGVTSATALTITNITVRGINGYLLHDDTPTSGDFSITAIKVYPDIGIRIQVSKNSGAFSVTNNTPIVANVDGVITLA